jgi:bis(5'-nucleosyl)-tetraphosphatase (symmetrical)
MATYLIGDIQGCYDPLQRLLQKINFDTASDRLLSCGDVVNRGGQSLATLRLLNSMGDSVVVTLGNHDIYLLSDHVRLPDGQSKNWEFREILMAQDRSQLLNWLRKQPLAYWSDDHRLLMVHAGVVPQWTVADTLSFAQEVESAMQSAEGDRFLAQVNKGRARRWKDERSGKQRLRMITSVLTRIRFCDSNGKALWSASGPPGTQPAPYRPWFRHRNRATRDVRMAFGHWAALGLRLKKRYIAMDSGCVWGGRLSAFRLEDERLFQVPGHFGNN